MSEKPAGTGGFLDPDKIIEGFGIKEGMTISDFGCGAGYFAISLAQKAGTSGRVYAFDIQEYALDNVRAKARDNSLDNIETVRTNLEIAGSSGLSDNSQDIVLLANILFQSNKKSDIIKEAARVVAPKGTLIIIDWKNGSNGFGPPKELRLNLDEIRKITEKEGLSFASTIDAGDFHFGLVFSKK